MDEVRRDRAPASAQEGREVYKLLAPDEPPPFFVHRPEGASPFFITCDHAGNLIPRRLQPLARTLRFHGAAERGHRDPG
jgi:hypothetical protein